VAASGKKAPRTRVAVVPLPAAGRKRADLLRHAPSGRSLLVGFALVGLAAGAYAFARESSLFAVRTLDVRGAPPQVAGEIRRALTPVEGASLVALDGRHVERVVAALPDVAAVEYDRAFPHTLVLRVRLERPLAVLRRGLESWLVSDRARVLRPLARGARPELARIWAAQSMQVERGGYVDEAAVERSLVALRTLRSERLPVAVRTVRAGSGELTLLLASGVELRLGDESDLRLKLAVAARILMTLTPRWQGGPAYLDVSVVDRPVAGNLKLST
jgi:cell division septal protein FtsQ